MAARLSKVLLYWRTLRHLKTAQLYWLARYRLSISRAGHYRAPEPLPPTNAEARDGLRDFARHWAATNPPDAARTDAFLLGRFSYLNKTIQSTQPRWNGLDVSKLWRYNLHYFDFARDVALLHSDPKGPGASQVHRWIVDWIEQNGDVNGLGWDPYPLSVRLLNWSLVLAIYGWEDFQIRHSMHVQIDFLRRHLERDLQGNHLLKNAAALTVAGALLNGYHCKLGQSLLRKEVRAQLLPDGGHAERSPMYHGHALVDLLLSTAVMPSNPEWLAEPTQRAIAFLFGVTHGDGRAAQFNDGAAEEGLGPDAIQALAKKYYFGIAPPKASAAYPDTGLYRMAPEGDAGVLIVKAGKSTLDHQPGHAHSDLLSFEYSRGAQRIFVNSGTHGYAESPYRDYCRSNEAHNTVRTSPGDQLEHWSTFRVGRRMHGQVRHWDPVVPSFRARCGKHHERAIQWDPRGWWRVTDTVIFQGKHAVQAYFHLHPDCNACPVEAEALPDGAHAYRVMAGTTTLMLLIVGVREVSAVRGQEHPCQGWYFPRFGEAVPATTLVCNAQRGAYRTRLGYALILDEAKMAEAASDLHQALIAEPDHR